MRAMFSLLLSFIFVSLAPIAGAEPVSFSEATKNTTRIDGFIDLYVNADDQSVLGLLSVDEDESDDIILRAIYTARLTAGLGSNPIGLDRGWGDSGSVIAFRRFGDRVIVEVENLAYRANPGNPLEARAVDESFADSMIASLDVKAEQGGRVLVDMTDFLTRDALGIVQHLKDRDAGSFSVQDDRTFVDTSKTFSFPDNTEIDVFLTLSSSDPGREVATTAANGTDATLIQHHSFVRLPDDGFEPRFTDPGMGAMEIVYYDYSAPLDNPIEKRLALRHRLETDADGNVIDPIVFYIDSGAPEPIRSALVEGAEWWADAFEAAGYEGAYEVRLLPEDAHPLDIRYNVVQWVHRQTRGWSYGGGVVDPRTGEFIKGHVNLGSLRVRQDRMIFEGLAGTDKTGTGSDDDPIELALDRIRQLSAHEVGHSLGIAHNFAASSYGKGSVMDYPAPDVRVSNGELDFSQTYGVGIGPWDKFAVKMIYGPEMSLSERQAAYKKAHEDGLVYVADSQGRGLGTGHPRGAIWDNGDNAAATLRTTMQVRRTALDGFDESRLRDGQPISDLNKVIVPIYLYHRYQLAAAAKLVGGMSFSYGIKGDDLPPAEIVDRATQTAALDAILDTLEPDFFSLSDETLNLLTPSLVSYSFADSDREMFKRSAYPAFDLTAAADTSAALTFDALMHPMRAARLVEFKRRDNANLGFRDVLSDTHRRVMDRSLRGPDGIFVQVVQKRYAYSLMDLMGSDAATPAVQAQVQDALDKVRSNFARRNDPTAKFMVSEIDRFLTRPAESAKSVTTEPRLPPGSPIGSVGGLTTQYETCWFCE